jgi:hypothetical protein
VDAEPLILTAVVAAIGFTAIAASVGPLRHVVLVNPADTLRAK